MRKFCLFSESWYAKVVPLGDRVVDDLFLNDENYVGELHIEWIDLNGNKSPDYKICCFNDSLNQLIHNLDVIFGLKSLPQNASPKLVCGLLLELGFTDATQRANPNEEKGYQDAVSGKPGKIGMSQDKNPEQYAYGQGYLRGLWETGNQSDLDELGDT